jgi:hypothetical protein
MERKTFAWLPLGGHVHGAHPATHHPPPNAQLEPRAKVKAGAGAGATVRARARACPHTAGARAKAIARTEKSGP